MTKPGYKIDRSDDGLTKREREVYDLLKQGKTLTQIGEALGVTKQRTNQIAKSLESKGRVRREGEKLLFLSVEATRTNS